MRAVAVYTGLRLVLFAAAAGLLYLAGLRSFLLVLVALVLSGVLSALLLTRQRLRMGDAVVDRVGAARRALDRRAAAEDEIADRMLAEQEAARRRTGSTTSAPQEPRPRSAGGSTAP